jgi:peptidoglycan/LPS O-acetylase OafA/YrhL
VEKRNIGIDLLRGCCILYIVGFWHLMNYTDAFPGYSNLATDKITAIILGAFVFISGFFIGKKDLTLEKQDLLNFFIRKGLFEFIRCMFSRLFYSGCSIYPMQSPLLKQF